MGCRHSSAEIDVHQNSIALSQPARSAMKVTFATNRWMSATTVLILTACMGTMMTPVHAAPPEKHKTVSKPALQRLGDFLFGSSRRSAPVKVDQRVRNVRFSQSSIVTTSYAASGISPVVNVEISPQEIRAALPSGRSALVLPVTPGVSFPVPSDPQDTMGLNSRFDTSARPSESVAPIPEVAAPVVLPPVPEQPDYGVPVPGSRGYVYAPQSPTGQAYVIDVRGLQPGAKVRDPRTGHVFLVPPF